MPISNCHLYAWRQFIGGKTETITLRATRYSRWADIADNPYWRYSLRPVGIALGYVTWPLVQLAWLLIMGKWAHVSTDKKEFVPNQVKTKHWLPPILFKGEVKELD